uniref:Uncharacterized protein n=1 Tax=Knipowitschia caucasica TaxID=637954 RepID=A0AAV2LPM6_KNICA
MSASAERRLTAERSSHRPKEAKRTPGHEPAQKLELLETKEQEKKISSAKQFTSKGCLVGKATKLEEEQSLSQLPSVRPEERAGEGRERTRTKSERGRALSVVLNQSTGTKAIHSRTICTI